MATQYLRKVKQKVAAKFSASRLILKSMSKNYLVTITPESIYILFQVMYEAYTEKLMTRTVFGYLILIQPRSQGLSSLFLDQGRQRRETLGSRLIYS